MGLRQRLRCGGTGCENVLHIVSHVVQPQQRGEGIVSVKVSLHVKRKHVSVAAARNLLLLQPREPNSNREQIHVA